MRGQTKCQITRTHTRCSWQVSGISGGKGLDATASWAEGAPWEPGNSEFTALNVHRARRDLQRNVSLPTLAASHSVSLPPGNQCSIIKDAVYPSCDHRDVKANVYAFPFLNSNVYIQVVYMLFRTWFFT